jgi:hypothetical protein
MAGVDAPSQPQVSIEALVDALGALLDEGSGIVLDRFRSPMDPPASSTWMLEREAWRAA